MADVAADLLPDIESYLNITWKDEATDQKITGYINRGMKRLQTIAGASLDFAVEDMPRSLLFDYCRYANSQALEVFEQNFQAELLDLNLRTQAPVIDPLIARISTDAVIVSPDLCERNHYVYQTGAGLTVPSRMDICAPPLFTDWDGISVIPIKNAQDTLIVEVNNEYQAVRAGKAVLIS